MMRPLRGRVAIREDLHATTSHYKRIIIPEASTDTNPDAARERRSFHIGTVVAMGPPALTKKRRAEIPPGFRVGDRVIFHWAHLEKSWHVTGPDGELLAWVPQQFVDAVVES